MGPPGGKRYVGGRGCPGLAMVARSPAAKKRVGHAPQAPAARSKPAATAKPPVIRQSVEITCSAQRAWTAITSPDEVNRWFTERCEFESRPGGRVLYWWNSQQPSRPDYVAPSRFGTAAECRVEAWDPPRAFTLQALAHWPGTVRFWVEAIPKGCRVSVEHAGWPKRDDWYKSHVAGWTEVLEYLQNYLQMPEAQYDAYVEKREAR